VLRVSSGAFTGCTHCARVLQGWAEDATVAYSAAIRACPRNDDALAAVTPVPGASGGSGTVCSTSQLGMLFALRATGHTRGLRWGAVANDVHAAMSLGLGHPGLLREALVRGDVGLRVMIPQKAVTVGGGMLE
jgi:hypothetical protein